MSARILKKEVNLRFLSLAIYMTGYTANDVTSESNFVPREWTLDSIGIVFLHVCTCIYKFKID